MQICQLLGREPIFSFEFFPPKTEAGIAGLFETLRDLALLQPAYVSITYGAGGSTRALTVDLAVRMQAELDLLPMAHLTCVGHTAREIDEVVDELQARGIENVLALRGDPPKGSEAFVRPEGGFGFASELIQHLRSRPICIGGACYPEGHVESSDPDLDLDHLKRKVDAGVDFLITQLFFDPETYLRFRDRCTNAGIEVPIIPGIMPVTNVAQLERFTGMCGAAIPASLAARLDTIRDDDAAVIETGIDWSTSQCRRLLDEGAPGIHFYTLNRSLSTRRIRENLGAVSAAQRIAAASAGETQAGSG